VNLPKFSQLRWFALVLVFLGVGGLIPLTILAFAIFRPALSEQDYGTAVAGLAVLSGGSLTAGVGILILESRFAQRHPN
jgi:hypothetical protein